MSEALFDELVWLDIEAAQWEATYSWRLEQADHAHARRHAIEARFFTLLNLSAWVNGQW